MPVGANTPTAAGRGGQLGVEPVLYGEVLDVILDKQHMSYDPSNSQVVGCCKVRVMPRDVGKDPDTCNWFQPHSNQDIEMPLIGEIVTLIRTGTSGLAITKDSANHYWHKPVALYPELQNNNLSMATGITGGTQLVPTLGFYTPEQTTYPLGLFEGDKILQGRYGQTIRFTTPTMLSPLAPWWKTGKPGDPVLSFSVAKDRNKKEVQVEDLKQGAHIVLSEGVLIKEGPVPHSKPNILLKSEKGEVVVSANKVSLTSKEWKADWTTLLDIVKELLASVEVLSKGTYPTGVGPTGPHPSEPAKLSKLKTRLKKLENK